MGTLYPTEKYTKYTLIPGSSDLLHLPLKQARALKGDRSCRNDSLHWAVATTSTRAMLTLRQSEMGLAVARVPSNMSIKVTKIVYHSTCEDGGVKLSMWLEIVSGIICLTRHMFILSGVLHMPVQVETYYYR